MYRVFRIEPKNRQERLYSVLLHDKILSKKYLSLTDLHDRDEYPGASEDFERNVYYNSNARFACFGFCSLINWFGTEYENLKKDFNICSYLVPNFIEGYSKKQVIFDNREFSERTIIYS